ncbi:MAG TPA: DUF1553 domain-containing protein [Fimbriiglobus sp.]
MNLPRLAAFCVALLAGSARAADVDFARDVMPILSDKCFRCHGPDEKARKKKLRLDTKEGAARVVTPGKSAESELYRRVSSTDADERMPPVNANRPLTAAQIGILKAWIDGGAKWERHWAFTPVGHPVPPRRTEKTQPIDAFILDMLDRHKIRPSDPAPKEVWLRRVTFDLTGLPPTLAEIDAFDRDMSPEAYERVVDRLLASPRYGERMAVDWLDVARFADTHGYQNDRYRPVWPYRDWVIGAFNKNLPFDRFATWQLAGDLLPHATREQKLATAFNRLHMQNEEGGVVAEEFRVAYVTDRVTTFGTAFLGLTLECCRCHDHKFDPISQKDFYSLFAFFQNIDESGQTSYFTEATPVPALLLSTEEQDRTIRTKSLAIIAAESNWKAVRDAARGDFEKWVKSKPDTLPIPGLVAHYPFDEPMTANAVNAKLPAKAVEGPKLVPGHTGKAVLLAGDNGFEFPGVGHFTAADPFTFAFWIKSPAARSPRAVVLHHSKAPVDAGSRGYEILLENGNVAVGLHHMWPGNSLKVRTAKPIPENEWTYLAVTYDGSSTASGLAIYINGDRAELKTIRDGLTKDITYGGGEPNLTLGYRFRDNGFKGGSVDDLRIYDRALSPLEVARLAGKPAKEAGPFDYYCDTVNERTRTALERLHTSRKDYLSFVTPIPEIMTMRELPTPKPAYVLKRGQYDVHGDRVTANTPGVLPPFPTDAPRNRLGLARWLTESDNPLFARVTVNRLWQQMFGKGLVETSNNFGRQGSPPTHPELLDWLARDFAEHGWDVKRELKQIALSQTYRQSSRVTPELLAVDPKNEFLARYPATRLTAEMIRDQALAVSGLLVEKLGGPSVKPYQPDGLWDMAMGKPKYDRSKGPDLYRRSLYTFWKRTMPHPQLTIFDAADRSVCTVHRQQTSTPLQALALLNDPQIVEAARFLAQRMLKEGGKESKDRIAWAYRAATGRMPTGKESEILAALFVEQRDLFENAPKDAEKLLAVGDTKSDPSLNKLELAAGTVLCLAVLNQDAAVMKR